MRRGPGRAPAAAILSVALLLLGAFREPTHAAAPGMRAPAPSRGSPVQESPLETSSVALAARSLIGLYRSRVSPLTTGRCGFSPSCSTYGLAAVRRLGPAAGAVAIGDRLIRCNVFKSPRDYPLLPTGKLWDPLGEELP